MGSWTRQRNGWAVRRNAQRTRGEGLTANRDSRRVILVVRCGLRLPVMLVACGYGFLGWTSTTRFLSREPKIQNEGSEQCPDKSRAHASRLSTLPLKR